jgi:UDP-2-acetamido-3-amino-2,3-dideoxy-glucuronate N-acetyltransferase
MVFTNVINPRAFIEKKSEFKRTLLKKGCSIGANATIVCGVTIGKFALIGAGSVVTKDVPDYALITGVPGKRAGWVCECGEVLKGEFAAVQCCGKSYRLENQKF